MALVAYDKDIGRAELTASNDFISGPVYLGLLRFVGTVAGDTCVVTSGGKTIWKAVYGGPGLPDVLPWVRRAPLKDITVYSISGGRLEVYIV
jgi:hypothetical protein